MEVDEFLAHHGVKGMHWGVRKDRASGGSGESSPSDHAKLKKAAKIGGAVVVTAAVVAGSVYLAKHPELLQKAAKSNPADVNKGRDFVETLNRKAELERAISRMPSHHAAPYHRELQAVNDRLASLKPDRAHYLKRKEELERAISRMPSAHAAPYHRELQAVNDKLSSLKPDKAHYLNRKEELERIITRMPSAHAAPYYRELQAVNDKLSRLK